MNDINSIEIEISNLIDQGKHEQAHIILKKYEKSKSIYIKNTLAWMFYNGIVAPQDQEKAIALYEQGAALGSVEAHYRVGWHHQEGGRLGDARKSFENGAALGHVECMYELGKMMLSGTGGPADAETGLRWLTQASAKNHIWAARKILSHERKAAKHFHEKIIADLKLMKLVVRAVRNYRET